MSTDSADGYDSVARDYEKLFPDYPAMARRWERTLSESFAPLGELPVLDLCCGDGLVTDALARLGREVVAIDLSEAMVRACRERTRRHGSRVHVRHGDVGRVLASLSTASFGAFVCGGSGLLHLNETQVAQVCEQLARVLGPGAPGLVEVFDWGAVEVGAWTPRAFHQSDGGGHHLVIEAFERDGERVTTSILQLEGRPGQAWSLRTANFVYHAHTPEVLLAAFAASGFRGTAERDGLGDVRLRVVRA